MIFNSRYCEMGLWTVAPERIQSSACSLYKIPLQLIEQGAKETVSVVQKPFNTLGGFVPDLSVADKSSDQNTKIPDEENTMQQETHGGLKWEVPLPRIPHIG